MRNFFQPQVAFSFNEYIKINNCGHVIVSFSAVTQVAEYLMNFHSYHQKILNNRKYAHIIIDFIPQAKALILGGNSDEAINMLAELKLISPEKAANLKEYRPIELDQLRTEHHCIIQQILKKTTNDTDREKLINELIQSIQALDENPAKPKQATSTSQLSTRENSVICKKHRSISNAQLKLKHSDIVQKIIAKATDNMGKEMLINELVRTLEERLPQKQYTPIFTP